MGLRDRLKKTFKSKTSSNGYGNRSDAVNVSDAQQGQENETTQRPKVRIEDTPISELWNHSVAAGLSQNLNLKPNMRDQPEKRMDEVNKKASKLRKFETSATEAVQLVLKIVDLANDYISGVASANPYTSIAWTGVSILLPIIAFDKSIRAKSFVVDDVHEKNNQFIAVENILRDIRLHEEHKAAEDRQRTAVNSLSAMEIALSKADASGEAEEYTKLLYWLCDIDPSSMYNAARDKHEAGTCGWPVQDSYKFKAWEEGKSSLLWLHGKAGSGKSVLSSSVIKHLQDRHASNPSTILAYFYFSFSDPKKQNVDGMLASLIKQIGSRQRNKQLLQRLGEYMIKEQRPDIKTLEEALMVSLSGFRDVYVVIDGLDECPVLNDRRERLLESLDYILANAPGGLHVFLTSRKELDIDAKIRPHLSEPLKMEKMKIDLLAHWEILNRDICHYIDSKLARNKFKSWPERLKMEARKSLLDKADYMFQYVQCQIEILQKLPSESEIHEALQKLPKGLDATYDRILEGIDLDFKERVINSVKWLAFSMRPLSLEELSEIFIIRPNRDIAINKNDRIISPEYILEYFSGLIVTQKREKWGTKYIETLEDTEDTTNTKVDVVTEVRLVHFSLKEYFISTRIKESAPTFAFTEVEAHISIGRSCLAYLTQYSSEIAECVQSSKFLDLGKYITEYWMDHLEEIPRIRWPAEWAQDAALVLRSHSQSFLNQLQADPKLSHMDASKYFPLQSYCYTARLGLYQLTQMLISQELNAYITQEDLDVALQHATSSGDIEVMRLFLEFGADVNAECGEWGTALLAAAAQGDLGALEFLVKFGANVNNPSEKGRCLLTSIHEQSSQCLKFLLDSGADIHMQGSNNRGTVLHWALRNSNVDQFKLLLERNANVNALGGEYCTPLQVACACISFDKLHFVKSLLENGADPNIQGGVCGTALQAVCSRFAWNQEVDKAIPVMQLLISHGADVNIHGGQYGSAFNAAATSRSSNVIPIMKLLLDNGAVIDQQGDLGSALHVACNTVSTKTVLWLLDNGADVNATTGRFATPLQAAMTWEYSTIGQEVPELVKLLINKGAQVNQKGGEYGTALQAAYSCRNGGEEQCRLLLEHGADIGIQGGKYGTVLAAACREGLGGVKSVRLLLDRGADVNAHGGEYGTALIAACERWEGAAEMVKLLLDHGADINAEGGTYVTALATACKRGKDSVVSLLLERGADPRCQNCLAWHMAARSTGKDGVPILKLLLDRIDVNHVHAEYGTALNAAIEVWDLADIASRNEFDVRQHYSERVRWLLERGADADIMGGRFGSALQTACAAEYNPRFSPKVNYDIDYTCIKTKLLLEQRPNINVNAQGGIFGTALQAAAYSGQTESIRLLLDKKADCNIRGGKYGSALNAAIIRGWWNIVEILLKAGAKPDCHLQEEPDKEWLQRVREEDGRGAFEKYMKFWEVQSASGGVST
ncbi:ankyrin repeat-containing domain protein [Trichoderma evansii]